LSDDSKDANQGELFWLHKMFDLEKLGSHKVADLVFIAFIMTMSAYYLIVNSILSVPIGDGIVFMINAHGWLKTYDLMEIYRPPLFSWIIAAIWIFTGENWNIIRYLQMSFTVAAIVLLYLLLRRNKGAWFALGVSSLTLTNAQLFFYTSQMLTEGLSLFFLILTLYFLEGTKRAHWILSGISIGLTFAARYPILLQAMIIFLVESVSKKDHKATAKSAIMIIAVILLVIAIVYTKTGTFQMALEKDSNFGISFSPFYIMHALPIWGLSILLLPVAFLFKSTYKNKFNYIFISWFIISLLSWSTNASNQQYRFMIQFMPAAFFLVVLAIENMIKFDRNNLIFLRKN